MIVEKAAKNDAFETELKMEVRKSNNLSGTLIPKDKGVKKVLTGQWIYLSYVFESLYNLRLIYAFVALKTIVR